MPPKRRGPDRLPRRRPSQERTKLLERWRARVQRAQKVRQDWETTYDVEKGERFFLGMQRSENDDYDRVFNHLWATIKTQRPNLFYQNPKFFVRPKPGRDKPVDDRKAAEAEATLDAIATQEDNLKRAGAFGVLQSFFRIGSLKGVYDPRLEPNPRAGEPIWLTDPETDEAILDPVTKEKIQLRDPRSGKKLVEPDEVLTDEAYRWEWVDARNMLLPDEGPDRTKWTWIGQEVEVPLEDAKDDTRFKANLRSQLQANAVLGRKGEKPTDSAMSEADKEHERLRYFECYDMRTKRWAVWADDQTFDDFLIEDDLQPGIEDHPYSLLLGYTPIMAPDPLPWPFPHVHPWLDVQSEYNIRRNQITEGARRSARKVGFDEDTFQNPDEAKKALRSSRDMEAVQLNTTDKPWVTIADPDLNPSVYRDVPLLQTDWRILTGQTGARLADPDSDTATEATFVERAGNLRDSDMQDVINDWLSEAGQKMLQLLQATLTLNMWVKMRGFSDKEFTNYVERVYGIPREALGTAPGLKEIFMERFGEEKWVNMTREKLQFEANVTVVPGSSRPRNLQADRGAMLAFMRILGQFPQLALSRELLKIMAEMHEIASDRLIDELHALARQMVDINARQAGRTEGGAAGQGSATDGGGLLRQMMVGAGG